MLQDTTSGYFKLSSEEKVENWRIEKNANLN